MKASSNMFHEVVHLGRHGDDEVFTRKWDVAVSSKSCKQAHCAFPVKFSRRGTSEVLSRYPLNA